MEIFNIELWFIFQSINLKKIFWIQRNPSYVGFLMLNYGLKNISRNSIRNSEIMSKLN